MSKWWNGRNVLPSSIHPFIHSFSASLSFLASRRFCPTVSHSPIHQPTHPSSLFRLARTTAPHRVRSHGRLLESIVRGCWTADHASAVLRYLDTLLAATSSNASVPHGNQHDDGGIVAARSADELSPATKLRHKLEARGKLLHILPGSSFRVMWRRFRNPCSLSLSVAHSRCRTIASPVTHTHSHTHSLSLSLSHITLCHALTTPRPTTRPVHSDFGLRGGELGPPPLFRHDPRPREEQGRRLRDPTTGGPGDFGVEMKNNSTAPWLAVARRGSDRTFPLLSGVLRHLWWWWWWWWW